MQKVEGSNPFSRSQKACICRPFLRAQSHCSSASGRTDSGLAAGRSSAVPRKTPCSQADSGSSEPKSFCGPAEGQVFGLLRPLPRLPLQRHDPADSARRRDTSGRAPWGPVRFQSGNREVGLDPLRDPGEPWPPEPRALRRTASAAAARSPSRKLVSRQSQRGSSPGCRFPSASRRPRAPGLGCWLSSDAIVWLALAETPPFRLVAGEAVSWIERR